MLLVDSISIGEYFNFFHLFLFNSSSLHINFKFCDKIDFLWLFYEFLFFIFCLSIPSVSREQKVRSSVDLFQNNFCCKSVRPFLFSFNFELGKF